MFENFSKSSRWAVARANQHAVAFRHPAIDICHVILGLSEEQRGLAALVIKQLAGGPDLIRKKLQLPSKQARIENSTLKLAQTDDFKKAIGASIEIARSIDPAWVGTQHILLGIFIEPGAPNQRILSALGLTLDQVSQQVIELARTIPREE